MRYLISILFLLIASPIVATPPDLVLSIDSTEDLDDFFGVETSTYSAVFGTNTYYTSMSYMQNGSAGVHYALINIDNEVYALATFENSSWSVYRVNNQDFEAWYQDTFNSTNLGP